MLKKNITRKVTRVVSERIDMGKQWSAIYRSEFKEEAVSLVNDQGYSVPEAAKALGINANMLYRWKEKLEAKQSGNRLLESERDELLRLRKENR